jgi:hypothetical protein
LTTVLMYLNDDNDYNNMVIIMVIMMIIIMMIKIYTFQCSAIIVIMIWIIIW